MMRYQQAFSLLIICGCFVLTQFALALYLPALPQLTHYFSTNNQALLLCISFGTLGYALGQLLWGTLSDKVGRRPVFIIALTASVALYILTSQVKELHAFYRYIFLIGFVTATFTSAGNALLSDILGHEQAKKGVAYASIALAAASVTNPLIGSQLLHYFGWKSIFIFNAAFAFILLLGVFFVIPESHSPKTNPKLSLITVYKQLLTHKDYMLYLLILGLSFGCLYIYFNVAPFIYKNIFQVPINEYGWLFLLSSITYLLGTIWMKIKIDKSHINSLLQSGIIIFSLGNIGLIGLAALKLAGPYSTLPTLALLFFGLGVIMPSAKAGALSLFAHHKGTAASLMKFTQIVLTTGLTLLATQLSLSRNLIYLASFFLVICVISIVLIWILKRDLSA